MTRRVWVVLAAVMLAGCSAPADVTPAPVSVPAPCAAEDSPGPCVWDASSRGNGRGVSFIRDAAGNVTYVPGNGWQAFRDVFGHTGCVIRVGPTSTVMCADGYRVRS